MRGRVVAWRLIVALAIMCAGAAHAQVSGFAQWSTDNDFRGRDLSADKPVAALGVGYDAANGGFLGTSVTGASFAPNMVLHPEWISYAGYAQRLSGDWSWEAGVTNSLFPFFSSYDYSELFVGAAWKDWNARLYYAPNYFGQSLHTLYAEINGSFPLDARLALSAHLGVLGILDAPQAGAGRAIDTQLGVNYRLEWASVRLSWVDSNRLSSIYPIYGTTHRSRWLLTLQAAF